MPTPPSISCQQCSGSMVKKRVAKHGGCLQLLGVLMMLPGILCLLLALALPLGIFSSMPTLPASSQAQTTEGQAATKAFVGQAVNRATIGGVGSLALLFVGAPSLAIGLILGASKKIWKCSNCGSFVERL